MSPAFLSFLPLTAAATHYASPRGSAVAARPVPAGTMRHTWPVLAAMLLLFPETAEATQLGRLRGMLRGAERVASAVGTPARTHPIEPDVTPTTRCDAVKTGTPLPTPGPRPAPFPEALWPADCPVSNLEHHDFKRGQALADAYHAASAVRCDGCVGTVTTHDDMVYGGLTDRQFGYAMGEWPMDRDVVRRGRRYLNTIHPVGEFGLSGERCKLFRWTLSDGDRRLAEKFSLICLFAGPYQRDKHWNALVL